MKTSTLDKVAGNSNRELTRITLNPLTCRKFPAKKFFNLTLLIFCIASFGFLNQSFAQITNGFELEGNATAVAPNPPDDWDLIYDSTDNALITSGIITDAPSASDNAFTQGSSDENDIPTWHWTVFTVPDKDDLLHGGAALYPGDQLFFFADRFATNGSAEVGIWFFKNQVAPLPDGTFSGVHAIGDILLLTNFVNGGGVAQVAAYEWVGTGGAFGNGTLDSLPVTGLNLFGITNSSDVASPWPYVPKSGPNDIFGAGAFYEGGIDLSGLGFTVDPCFTSFMIQTRASHSLGSELKDFLFGNFFTQPSVTVNSPTICPGGSATLTATAEGGIQPLSYLWSTGATTSSITVSPASTTTYTVTVTGANGCSAEPASGTVTVNPLPVCDITGDLEICVGGSTTLTASGGTSFLWSTGATTASITVSPLVTTTYTVTVTDDNTCSSSCTETVTVNPLPVCDITGDLEICIGESTTLTASGGTSFLWSTGATTASITVNPAVTTTYTVTVTDANGCSSSCTETVTVNLLPVCDITGDLEICVGESTTLTASGGTSFLWSTTETTASITVSPLVTTTYTVTVTDANGCSSSCTETVTVNPLPVCDITGDLEICVGESTTLTASGGTSFLWSTTETTASITVSPLVTTTYTVTVTDANGCSSSCTITVTVNPLPVCDIAPANPEICIGGSATLTASGGVSFLWSTTETTASITVSPVVTTTYTVTVTDANGCSSSCTVTVTVNELPVCDISGDLEICVGESTTLTASGGSFFLWSTGETTASITVSPLVTTSYTVTVSDGNDCSSSCTETVTVNPLPVCDITGDLEICVGESTTLTASGGTSFLWSTAETTASITVSPVATTTYTVTVTDANGCSSSCSVTVIVNPLPPCTIGNTDPANVLCNTGNYTIGTSLSPALFSFFWTMSVDGNIPGWAIIGSNTGQTITFSTGDCGPPIFLVHFTLTVTDLETGCQSTCSTEVGPGAPQCVVDIRPPVVLNCLVTSQYLLAIYATDFVNPIFMWSRNNVPIGAGINDGNGLDSILITQSGSYRFSITNPLSLDDSCFAEVEVEQNINTPSCVINLPATAPVCNSTGNSLSATITSLDPVTFVWTSSNASWVITSANNVNPITYNAGSGNTTWTLTITNTVSGCVGSCSATDTCASPFLGCTPGFWKTHPNLWNDSTDAVSTCIANAITALGAPYSGNGTTSSLFRTTFGLTNAQMTAAGYSVNLTLLQAINLGGGGFNKLARHGISALLNSCSFASNFPYSTAQVLTSIHNAVINLTPEPLATQFAAANDTQPEGCPPGGSATPGRLDGGGDGSFTYVKAFPNPFSSQTTIEFTVPATHATLNVYDVAGGKVAELFNGSTVPDQLYQVTFNGDSYTEGIYFYRLTYDGNVYYDKLTLIK